MNTTLRLKRNPSLQGIVRSLPSSKSISNRALILQALSKSQTSVSNLSVARDTRLMQELIGSSEKVIDVMDAGTTMRFLTAYFALRGKNKTITGTERMQQRPIGILVNALREIGATIEYLGRNDFPPVEVNGFSNQKASNVSMPGDVSSQYISALMMMAPVLPQGLHITLEGEITSRPYLEMTRSLMKVFGVNCSFIGNSIQIPHADYKATNYKVEADWSAASYWFAFVALANTAEIFIPEISVNSLQGDTAIIEMMDKLGVKTEVKENGIALGKKEHLRSVNFNFSQCPDLAQTVLPVCSAKNIRGTFTGLESLRIKETDRIAALQTELKKIGAELIEDTKEWKLVPSKLLPSHCTISTYHDHRMAMGFAPLATLMDLEIENPEVVNKSYPSFWEDLKLVGS